MLPLCCQDVSAACHLLSGGHLTKNYYLSFLSLVLSRCVIFCQQPVKMCHLLSGGHLLLLFILFVPCAVKMCHLLSAACQDVSSFVRWTFIIIYPFVPCAIEMCHLLSGGHLLLLFILFVPCAVKMCHLLSAACQDVSSFIRWTFIIIYPFCPLCYRDVSSFVSSLSRCVIFCQVDIYYPFCPLCCQDVSSFVSSLSRCAIFVRWAFIIYQK